MGGEVLKMEAEKQVRLDCEGLAEPRGNENHLRLIQRSFETGENQLAFPLPREMVFPWGGIVDGLVKPD